MASNRFRDIVQSWADDPAAGDVEVDIIELPRAPAFAEFPPWLPERLVTALRDQGIDAPWSHQVRAWELLAAGRNAVVATPTASGKTLCYNAPAVARLLRDPDARALYLFPTKALARDQEAAVLDLTRRAGIDAAVAVYDGDTPPAERRRARQGARILITNPDMLHVGILPHHANWSDFLARLELVVIDELHQYRGVFGSHVANVIRRLERVARFHGADPCFAACSATIGNPRDLAQAICEQPFEPIDESGAPLGARRFLAVNPQIVDPVRGVRRSAIETAARLTADLVTLGVLTLLFSQTRQGVEIALRYLRERLARAGRDPERVRGYRGGYLPTLRREIESSLRAGEVDAVVATNALELGIDVGELDAVVLAGYPGTIAALRQRAGRAGRRQTPSLAVLVTRSTPLDQFLAREPAYLLEASPERALVQPDNLEILLAQLACAAFELPFDKGERFGATTADETVAALECLVDDGRLTRSGGRYHYVHDAYPAAEVGLRDTAPERITAVDLETGEVVTEVDQRVASRELHEQAVYQHEGRTWLVERLDLDARQARLRPAEPSHYTVPVTRVRLEVDEVRDQQPLGAGVGFRGTGDVVVTEEITGFKRVRFRTHENLGAGPVDLPPRSMETQAAWLAPDTGPGRTLAAIGRDQLTRGLEGLGHALAQVASLRLMCDSRDVAVTVQQAPERSAGERDDAYRPALFLYDAHTGGVGLSEQVFEDAEPILADTARLIRGCPCEAGCPACVGPLVEGESPDVKQIAGALALALAGGEAQRR
jgi:DEAD/DEAH box helicase domain-containing protein